MRHLSVLVSLAQRARTACMACMVCMVCMACMACMACAGCSAEPDSMSAGLATVSHIVDGDTIDVVIDGRTERIRLIGIDTPETKKPNSPVECFGPQASDFIATLLPLGATVRIERDIVANGFARPLTIEPNSIYADKFAAAARAAEMADRGLWSACAS